MTQDELTVYQAWPEAEIRSALAEFKEQMYDGADVAQLQAGLRCLDFLCTRSSLSSELQDDIDGTITQANMRIELLLAQPRAGDSTAYSEEAYALAEKGVEQLRRLVQAYRDRFLTNRIGYSVDCVYGAVQERVRQRLLARA